MIQPVVVLGAGGHGRVVTRLLQDIGYQVVAFYDDNPQLIGSRCLDLPVLGPIRTLQVVDGAAIVAVGANAVRKQLAAKVGARWLTAIHPRAFVDKTAVLGAGIVVLAGAVVQAGAVIGNHVIVNTGATVDHDCVLGDYAQLAPGVHLSGAARIDEGAFLGVGAVVTPGRCVGAWSTVGAGAAVISDVAAGTTAIGVPAKPKHE